MLYILTLYIASHLIWEKIKWPFVPTFQHRLVHIPSAHPNNQITTEPNFQDASTLSNCQVTMAFFDARYKLRVHLLQVLLVHVVIGLSVPRLFIKNQPRTRANTIALGMVS